MIKTSLFFLFFMMVFNVSSQVKSYKLYNKFCYEAEFKTINNKEKAWTIYNKIFKEFFPQLMHLEKAIAIGEELKKNNKKIEKELIQLINLKKFFFDKNFFLNRLSNNKTKIELKKHFIYLTENDFDYISSEKIENIFFLEKLINIDQAVRKIKNSSCKDSVIISLDKKNFQDLKKFIETKGFPSQREYGIYSLTPHFIYLHNTMYEGIIESIATILENQIKIGNYHPSQYARLIDRYRTWVLNEPQIYGEWIENGKIGKILNVENVDKIREDFGLESLYEFCLKNNLQLPLNYIIPKIYKK